MARAPPLPPPPAPPLMTERETVLATTSIVGPIGDARLAILLVL